MPPLLILALILILFAFACCLNSGSLAFLMFYLPFGDPLIMDNFVADYELIRTRFDPFFPWTDAFLDVYFTYSFLLRACYDQNMLDFLQRDTMDSAPTPTFISSFSSLFSLCLGQVVHSLRISFPYLTCAWTHGPYWTLAVFFLLLIFVPRIRTFALFLLLGSRQTGIHIALGRFFHKT